MGLKNVKIAVWLVVLALLGFAGTAKADTVYVNGTYAFADYSSGTGYGIPPYGGTLTSGGVTQNEQFFCVDFAHQITGGMSWNVTVTSLTGSNFSSTFLGNQNTYLELAWLVTKMMGAPSQMIAAQYQYAIWSLTGGPNPYGTNSSLLKQAAAAIGSFNAQGWEILTPTGNQGQEFLIYTSEPSVLVMLLAGLLALALVAHKRLGV